jgi:transposase
MVELKSGPTAMRKQINGLWIIASKDLGMDPFAGRLFPFCNKHRRILKIICWDRNRFRLWLKRLEADKFPWLEEAWQAAEIT